MINRRHFRPWMLAILFTLCGLMAFTSCSYDDEKGTEPAIEGLRDGEWTGSGEGRSGNIIAKIIVEQGKIVEAIVVSQSESVFAQDAINTILGHAVGKQDLMSVEVDGVTGATLTSTGVVDAINMAILTAMGKQTKEARTYKDSSCDIVVVGAGGAGLSAAVAAAETGNLKIIVLEKQGIIGGNTNYSTGGINAAETDVQKELGIEDSKQLFFDDIMRGGKNENIPSLVWNFVNNAPTTISWLTTMGADLSDVGLMAGSSVKRTHRPKGGTAIGPHLMKVLKEATAHQNIEIRTSNKVIGLLSSNGKVTGVKVQNTDGSNYTLKAKAVIIATGGFGANLEMVTRLQPSLSGFATLNHPGATGDAFNWMSSLGGATIQLANIQIHPTAEATNHILITEAVRGNGAISIETYANQHLLVQGNTLSELASLTGIPAESLMESIARYNAQQKEGVDNDFHRNATEMTAPLETAPFYAVRVKPAIHHTMGGLSVNTETQVLKTDGTPIPGLFAAGEVTGGLHGANRLGGNGVADIVVNGRLAGLAAARQCK